MIPTPEKHSRLLCVRWLGQLQYEPVWKAMQAFTRARSESSEDEIWLVEHPPVYTLGLSCKNQKVRPPNDIPVISTDRGGQITYHGPGQIVAYVLVDMRRRHWGIKRLVQGLEQAVIDLLSGYKIIADRHQGAPGIYVNGKKIAALGLRVTRGCSYHGIALNVDMELGPFKRIDPCGYPELETTQLRDFQVHATPREIGITLSKNLAMDLGYNGCNITDNKPDFIRNA